MKQIRVSDATMKQTSEGFRLSFKEKIELAKQMLRELAETSNAVQSNEIFDMAEEQGISKRTLENAKKELGIRARKINNSWYWELDKIKQI